MISSVESVTEASIKINNIISRYTDEELSDLKKLNKKKNKVYSLTLLNCKFMKHSRLNDESNVMSD